jgi:predicted transcriptional regulator
MERERDRLEDVLEVLSRRYDVLSRLAERPAERPALVEQLDSSQATVYRGIKRLEELGLVRYGTDGYALTTTGRVLVDWYEDVLETLAVIREAQSLLDAIPQSPSVPAGFVREATVVAADGPASHAPGSRVAELLGAANRVRALAKAHSQPDAVDVWHDNVVERGIEVVNVFEREFAAYLQGSADPKIQALLASDNFSAYQVPDVPYGLFLLEFDDRSDRALLLAYDEDERLRGLVETASPAGIDWAESVFRRYHERATPLDEASEET